MDEMEEYRNRIERRRGDRRLKNERRTYVRRQVKFWDLGMAVNAVVLAIAAAWLYFASKLGGQNG